MAESDLESVKIEELDDVYDSSSYCPSLSDYSDSSASLNRSTSKCSKQNKVPDIKNVDEPKRKKISGPKNIDKQGSAITNVFRKESEKIDELADIDNSSPYCSSGNDERDSEASTDLCTPETPKQKKISNSKQIDEWTEIADYEKTDEPRAARSDILLEGTFQKIFRELKSVKDSSDVEEEFCKFRRKYCYSRLEKTLSLIPQLAEKIRTLDIEIADIDSNDYEDIETNKMCKRTRFSRGELGMVYENWKCFCKEYGFDPDEDGVLLINFTYKKQKKNFKCYMSQHLPNRLPNEVFAEFVKMYYVRHAEKFRFTAEEDEFLMTWNEVSRIQNRGSHLILYRVLQRPVAMLVARVAFLQYKSGILDEKLQTPWYAEDILKRPSNEYPDWTLNESSWREMAGMSDNRDVKELKKAYFLELYPSLKATSVLKSSTFQRELIKELFLLDNPSWNNVDWKALGETCYNVGAVRVYSVMRALTKKYVPVEKWHDLEAALMIIEEAKNKKKACVQMNKGGRKTCIKEKRGRNAKTQMESDIDGSVSDVDDPDIVNLGVTCKKRRTSKQENLTTKKQKKEDDQSVPMDSKDGKPATKLAQSKRRASKQENLTTKEPKKEDNLSVPMDSRDGKPTTTLAQSPYNTRSKVSRF